jgi:large subunit ribosomal protein L22
MPYDAKHRFARIAPRKARLLMDLVRGRDVDDALSLLRVRQAARQRTWSKRSCAPLSPMPPSRKRPSRNTLFVAKAWVDPGPDDQALPAEGPRQGVSIMKRTSHLWWSWDEREEEDCRISRFRICSNRKSAIRKCK